MLRMYWKRSVFSVVFLVFQALMYESRCYEKKRFKLTNSFANCHLSRPDSKLTCTNFESNHRFDSRGKISLDLDS